MTEYKEIKINLSDGQKSTIRSGIKNDAEVIIQINKSDFGVGSDVLKLTQRQIEKLSKLKSGTAGRITLSRTQLKNQYSTQTKSNTMEFMIDPKNFGKLSEQDLLSLRNLKANQVGDGLGGLFKAAVPFIKNVLPKVLGSLGLAAASGAISGATHKATKGKGLFRHSGGACNFTKCELEDVMKLGNYLVKEKMLERNFVNKMNKDIQEQKGGFLGTLVASLAGSLLPSLLGGKGLYRAGDKK